MTVVRDLRSYRGVAYVIKPWDLSSSINGIKQYQGYNYGCALLCLPIDNKFGIDEPICSLTNAQINEVCAVAESKGLEVVLKCHNVSLYADGQGNKDRPVNPKKWFDNYRVIVNRIANIAVSRGYKKIIISNEMHNVLNIAIWKKYFVPIINLVKSKGLSVSCSTNIPEIRSNDGFQYWDELDFFSVNTYPQLTDKGKEWAKANPDMLKNDFYIQTSALDANYGDLFKNLGGYKNLSKNIWVTELGCIPSTTGLLYPAYWGSGQVRDEEVQKLYMNAVMDIIENDQASGKLTNRLSRYVLWDGNSDSDFNMIGKQAQVVLDKYWSSI